MYHLYETFIRNEVDINGHYACICNKDTKPPKHSLDIRQPGNDGSTEVKLPGGCDVHKIMEELSAEAIAALPVVAEHLAEYLLLKVQHKTSIAAFNNNLNMLEKNQHLSAGYRECLKMLAPDYNKALALVGVRNKHVRCDCLCVHHLPNSKCAFVYRGEHCDDIKCAKCGQERSEKSLMYYLPLTPCAQHLVDNKITWNVMQWRKHKQDRRSRGQTQDGAMPDIWYSPRWEIFCKDKQMEESGAASIALAFNIDGVCPFKLASSGVASRKLAAQRTATKAARNDNSMVCKAVRHALRDFLTFIGTSRWEWLAGELVMRQITMQADKIARELGEDVGDVMDKIKQRVHNVRNALGRYLKTINIEYREGKTPWTTRDVDNLYLRAYSDEAIQVFKMTASADATAEFEADNVTVADAKHIIDLININVLNVKDPGDDSSAAKRKKKDAKPTVGWLSGSSEYARRGSAVSKGDVVFLVVPGYSTPNVPEYVGIVRVTEDISIESGMSMVSVCFEWVDEDVARELGALAGDGVGAMAVDAIDSSAVTACFPSARVRSAEWHDAWGALKGIDVKWPAVGLLFKNARSVAAAEVLKYKR
ncbi:hypothetical protein FOA52_007748 [Chlamydomonas sp. UWO 241]|nr:hypothetical protein FOA52_007748 [Chlamydomonas sp. UWO 241]